MIDFTPDQAGGAIYWIVVGWLASGLVGVVFRGLLLRKYWVDLHISTSLRMSEARKSISHRGIEQSVLHIVVKLLVVAVGVTVAVIEFNTPDIPPPSVTSALALLAIPWLLTLDGWREYQHQHALLNIMPTRDMLVMGEDTNSRVRHLEDAIEQNTALTKDAAAHARAAYHEANTVNEKIAQLTKDAVETNEQGNLLMSSTAATGEDTNARVRNVEESVANAESRTSDAAAVSDARLDALEEQRGA